MQSMNTSESNEPGTAPEAPETTGLDSLADLLAENEPSEGGEDPEGEAVRNDDDKASPVKFNDLAEATGLDLDTLYALEVATNDGETVTVQDLKNGYSNQNDFTLKQLEWEEQRESREAELRKVQAELTEVINGLPANALTPEVLEKARAKMQARSEEQQALTLEAIPEWKNEETRAAELAGMAKYLQDFGFPADFLAQVNDHRMFSFIRSAHLRKTRMDNALKKVTPPKPDKSAATVVTGKSGQRSAPAQVPHRSGDPLKDMFANL